MTTPSAALLIDAFGRVQEHVHAVVDGLDHQALSRRLDADANSIAWLIWHMTRVEDDHVAGLASSEQVWIADGWADRFALPFDPREHGYGHTSEQVAQVVVEPGILLGYHDGVHAKTVDYLSTLIDEDLPEIVDRRWDPPVTRAVRLVSIVDDCIQHAGQAAFIRGVIQRAG